ncbi:MAG: hypothetical protein ACRDO8_00330 [Nocardioidaceae bacterium]
MAAVLVVATTIGPRLDGAWFGGHDGATPAASSTDAGSSGDHDDTREQRSLRRAAVDDALHRCKVGYAAEQDAVHAAHVTLHQWDVHIGAMNKLVAGEITLAKARSFWAETRDAAAKNAHAFRSADRAYREQADGCAPLGPTLSGAADPSDAAGLTTCAVAMHAGERVLVTARTALTTWEHHIKDMNRLRSGKLSPQKATDDWQKNWKMGNMQMKMYHKPAAADENAHCPLA